jgi:hypothetical protein
VYVLPDTLLSVRKVREVQRRRHRAFAMGAKATKPGTVKWALIGMAGGTTLGFYVKERLQKSKTVRSC